MTDGLNTVNGDSIAADIAEATNAIVGKENVQNVANNEYTPNIAINNAQQDQIALILFHVSNQNSLLYSLATKLDNHVTRVEDRFRALENTTGKLETAVNGMADRLRVMEKSNAELEHASDYRGRQTTQLESQLSEVKRAQNEMMQGMAALKTEVMSLRADIPKHTPDLKQKDTSIPEWRILLLGAGLTLFIVFILFLGFKLMGGA